MRFRSDTRGNVAMIFALSLLPLMVCGAMAVDYGVWVHQKQELQRIADEAAFAAAQELYMSNASAPQVASSATSSASKQMIAAGMMSPASAKMMTESVGASASMTSSAPASASFTAHASGAASSSPSAGRGDGSSDGGTAPSRKRSTTFGDSYSVTTSVNINEGTVEVVVVQTGAAYFSEFIMPPPDIRVSTVARVVGGGRICVLALEASEANAVNLQDTSKIQAERCGVFSNSTSSDGLSKESGATITAEMICSAGGYNGSASKATPEPVTDCPAIDDPLASREPPAVGGCDYNNVKHMVWKATDVTLTPGVYCGGLILTGPVKVWLEPGIYVMKDGPLITTLWAELRGDNVGIYMTGEKARFSFSIEGVVELTAPADGPMAGILFFEDRDSPPLRRFEIYSDEARVLLGTIYLPNGKFIVGTPKPIADLSAYTAIVARRIELLKNPTLVLNSNYSATNIPVPDGMNRSGGTVILAK